MTETLVDRVIAPIEAIPPGEGRTFQVDSERIAIFNTRSGKVFAVQADCPHRGGPLSDGLLGGATLICPLHNWKFDLPTGNAELGSCGLKTYSVRLSEGKIVLTISGDQPGSKPVCAASSQ